MDDLIKEFLAESNEGLERMYSERVKLESDPSSAEMYLSHHPYHQGDLRISGL